MPTPSPETLADIRQAWQYIITTVLVPTDPSLAHFSATLHASAVESARQAVDTAALADRSYEGAAVREACRAWLRAWRGAVAAVTISHP